MMGFIKPIQFIKFIGEGDAPEPSPYELKNTDDTVLLNTDGTPLEATHD